MIIGASRGIGLEMVRQYAGSGWRVHGTSRTPDVPGGLNSIPGEVTLHELDVRSAIQREDLVQAISSEGIDLLVHCSGVSGIGMSRAEVMRVNAEAPIEMAEALVPALQRGEEKKVVLMTSRAGSRTVRQLNAYGESKAALHDVFRERSAQWGASGLIAVVMHPGSVRTRMGGATAALSVEQSVTSMRRVIGGLGTADHGRFWQWDGSEHPW